MSSSKQWVRIAPCEGCARYVLGPNVMDKEHTIVEDDLELMEIVESIMRQRVLTHHMSIEASTFASNTR